MILLDTNVLSELMRSQPNRSVLAWVDAQEEAELYICAISKAEIAWGIGLLKAGKQQQNLQGAADKIFDLFATRCLVYGCETALYYTKIALHARQSGRPMTVEDMMIAAIAREHNAVLATRNIKDFESLPSLQLFNPWA